MTTEGAFGPGPGMEEAQIEGVVLGHFLLQKKGAQFTQ